MCSEEWHTCASIRTTALGKKQKEDKKTYNICIIFKYLLLSLPHNLLQYMNQNERDILLQKLAEANQKVLQANNERDAALKKLKEYEEMTQKAEKASKMKSLFLANMSHEIRTPLNAIEGFSRIMAEMDIAEERMKFLEIIESSNNRLQSLINEILDLSRV